MSDEVQMRGGRKSRRGVVISRSGDKSIIVQGERRLPHPKYGKVIRQTKKYHVHDATNVAAVGDTVEIAECRPLSATKRWRLVSKVTASEGAK
jgi:small subunit ribosomal protein S17